MQARFLGYKDHLHMEMQANLQARLVGAAALWSVTNCLLLDSPCNQRGSTAVSCLDDCAFTPFVVTPDLLLKWLTGLLLVPRNLTFTPKERSTCKPVGSPSASLCSDLLPRLAPGKQSGVDGWSNAPV
jgi:hypothetical protein